MAEEIPDPRQRAERPRLETLDRSPHLTPWLRADPEGDYRLYWLSVASFPMSGGQRDWLMTFFERLVAMLKDQYQMRPELFLEFKKQAHDTELRNKFSHTAVRFAPVIGLGRKPGEEGAFPEYPTEEDYLDVAEGRRAFDFGEYVADYCYWFSDKAEREQRESFLGYGAMTFLFLAPDPAAAAPEFPFSDKVLDHPLLKKLDVKRLHAQSFALLDGFLDKSKEVFGKGLEKEPEFEAVPFILPLLETKDFMGRDVSEVTEWFEVFDIYVRECPGDKGIVMATKQDMEKPLIELLKQMREEGYTYPSA